MFKAKYKAHKLVNVIFYIIVFLIGFYMGVMGRNIGFKEIFNKVLFIDNVSALDSHIYYYNGDYTHPSIGSSGTYKSERYIYNMFEYFIDELEISANFNQFHYVLAMNYSNVSGTNVSWYFTPTPLTGTLSNFGTTGSYINITYHSGNSIPNKWIIQTGNNFSTSNNIYGNAYSNQEGFGSNTLNFANYFTLEFNPYTFSNFSDMKQVCIDPHKPFAISTNTIDNNNVRQTDFLWFGGGLTNLKKAGLYRDSAISSFEDFYSDISYFNSTDMIINSKDILSFSNTTDYSSIGNINYAYWSAIPFTFHYREPIEYEDGDITWVSTMIDKVTFPWHTFYPVFKFDDNFTITEYSSNGVSRRHVDLSNSSSDNLQVCFYINEIYDITSLETDEYGNYYGTLSDPYTGGTKDVYVDSSNYDFFGNFNLNTFGLSSIITSPLVAIRSISNGTCSPITINLLGKTITLPCGDTIFWGREDVQTFKVFWNMFFGGIICYGIGISIFKSVRNFKDPDNDKVEVIDL